jgi:hypothetical protein
MGVLLRSYRYMPGMDLGVLKDMPGIREKASGKLARREVIIAIISVNFAYEVFVCLLICSAILLCSGAMPEHASIGL